MLKLNVGLAKRTSEADSQSCNASTNLEADLDSDLISQPDRLGRQPSSRPSADSGT